MQTPCRSCFSQDGRRKLAVGPPYIVYVTFKFRIFDEEPRLSQQRIFAPALYPPSLMKGESTEAAATETAPHGSEAEFNLSQCGDTALFFIRRMTRPLIRQFIHIVQLYPGQRLCRRILNHIYIFSVILGQTLGRYRIRIAVLYQKALCVQFFRSADIRKEGSSSSSSSQEFSFSKSGFVSIYTVPRIHVISFTSIPERSALRSPPPGVLPFRRSEDPPVNPEVSNFSPGRPNNRNDRDGAGSLRCRR